MCILYSAEKHDLTGVRCNMSVMCILCNDVCVCVCGRLRRAASTAASAYFIFLLRHAQPATGKETL
jgi:hypothetical protein